MAPRALCTTDPVNMTEAFQEPCDAMCGSGEEALLWTARMIVLLDSMSLYLTHEDFGVNV